MQLNLSLPSGPDLTPFTDQRDVSKQARLDGEYIEPGHVGAWVAAVQYQILDLVLRRTPVSRSCLRAVQFKG
jgi:hypothetical protein